MGFLEDEGDPFEGEAEGEEHQSREDDGEAPDRVEDGEDQVAEEGNAEGELEQEEHFGVWCVFMLSSLVVSGSKGATLISSILVFDQIYPE